MREDDSYNMQEQPYNVDDVFTPTSPADKNFVERQGISEIFVNALKTRGTSIIIYGHSGTGKTTLARNKIRQIYEDHISITCTENTSYDELIIDAFDQLDPYFIDESTTSRQTKASASLKAEYMKLKAQIGTDTTSLEQNKEKRILPPQLTKHRLGHFLGSANMCWVIDDFHLLEESVQRKISQVMKVYMDLSPNYKDLKIITIGVFDTGQLIVKYNKYLRGRVAEINVPLLTEEEIVEIIDNGQKLLNFRIEDHAKNKIVKYSNGLPNVCHRICLNICCAADITETQSDEVRISKDNLDTAMHMYMDQSSATIHTDFEKAFQRIKRTKYNNSKLIIWALTNFGIEGAAPSDILSKIREVESKYPSGNLSKYLKLLTMEERGSILRYHEVNNQYSFNDPCYHTFAQILIKQNRLEDFIEKDIDFNKYLESKETVLKLLREKIISEYFI